LRPQVRNSTFLGHMSPVRIFFIGTIFSSLFPRVVLLTSSRMRFFGNEFRFPAVECPFPPPKVLCFVIFFPPPMVSPFWTVGPPASFLRQFNFSCPPSQRLFGFVPRDSKPRTFFPDVNSQSVFQFQFCRFVCIFSNTENKGAGPPRETFAGRFFCISLLQFPLRTLSSFLQISAHGLFFTSCTLLLLARGSYTEVLGVVR